MTASAEGHTAAVDEAAVSSVGSSRSPVTVLSELSEYRSIDANIMAANDARSDNSAVAGSYDSS